MNIPIHFKIIFLFTAAFHLQPKVNAQITLQSASPFPFGASINVSLLKNNPAYRSVVSREYNSITPENAMKIDAIHPGENTWFWDDADTLINFAEQNGKRLHGHVLIWHNALPAWVTNFSGDTAAWDTLMKRHIQTVVGHYAGRIRSWDVVNEAIKDDGSFRNADPGGSIWMQHLGQGYIAKAFQYAHEADPAALLFYNDYGHDYSSSKLSAIYALVNDLINTGVPINGVGLQMHLNKNTSYVNVANAISTMSQTGLLVHISEMDVALNPQSDQSAIFNDPLSQLETDTYKFVTRYYKTKVPVAQQYGITTWNVADADTWIRPTYSRPDWPLPFDDNYEKKLAYQGIIDGLTGSFDFTAATPQNLPGIYTDLGSNGTPITTSFYGGAMTTDGDNSSVQDIGFGFMFNGTLYNKFVLNTNGFIKFGLNAPSPGLFYSTATGTSGGIIPASDIDLLYPYDHDLWGTAATEYRVYTTGIAGSRICTIQFKNVMDKLTPSQYSSINFQIKLYEAGNVIDFIYGDWTASGNSPSSVTAAIGIKGIYDSSVNISKSAITAWSSAFVSFINGNYPGFAFNTQNTVLPDPGRIFRFRSNQAILPLNILQLSAVQTGVMINVNWQTSGELNTKEFEIQRSVNGTDFISLGTVTAKGNSTANYYNYTDADVFGLPATLFYRLVQKDKDGTSKVSNIVHIKKGNKENFLVNVINPVKVYIDVLVQCATPGKISMYVLSLNGALIMNKEVNVPAGSSVVSMQNAHALAKGTYILKVIKDKEERLIRITR